jgi:RHS repeat-associated protein
LGSGTLITDANGNAYQFFVNLPFGETLAEQKASGTYNNVYKFTGKELDSETGLYYLGARYYSPVDGIFLSTDPLAGSFPSWGPYVYTLNNPVRLTDPTGMAPEDIIIRHHKGMNKEQREQYANNVLKTLSNLTDDKLALDGNKIVIASKNESGTKPNGTALIRGFAEGFQKENGETVKRDVTIGEKLKGMVNATSAVDGLDSDKASNGVGTNSKIAYDFYSNIGTGYIDPNGQRQLGPDEMVVAHELIHAGRIALGQRVSNQIKCSNCTNPNLPLEEAQVQQIVRESFHPENPILVPLSIDPYKK